MPIPAISVRIMASWASCSALAALGDQRPRISGTVKRKKVIPPKQIQYQSFHWLGSSLAALATVIRWASRNAKAGISPGPALWN